MRELPPIGHVGFIVENLDESVEKFKDFYGVKNYIAYDFIPKQAWAYGREIFDCVFRIAQMLPESGPKLELIEVVSGAKTPQLGFIREHGQNINHVAYYVDDYEGWHKYYEQLPGAHIVFEIVAEDATMGRRASFYAEQQGVAGTVEISQKTKV